MKKILFAGLLLAACAVTERARLRAQAENHLEACLFEVGNNQMYVRQCLEESSKWCQEHGLERSCGADNLYSQRR